MCLYIFLLKFLEQIFNSSYIYIYIYIYVGLFSLYYLGTNIESSLKYLQLVGVGHVADVSDANYASIFRIKLSRYDTVRVYGFRSKIPMGIARDRLQLLIASDRVLAHNPPPFASL
jgi:hypothetical protein